MTDAQKPGLIVVAGPNGSGKTTITEKLFRHAWMVDCQYINPDLRVWRLELPCCCINPEGFLTTVTKKITLCQR